MIHKTAHRCDTLQKDREINAFIARNVPNYDPAKFQTYAEELAKRMMERIREENAAWFIAIREGRDYCQAILEEKYARLTVDRDDNLSDLR